MAAFGRPVTERRCAGPPRLAVRGAAGPPRLAVRGAAAGMAAFGRPVTFPRVSPRDLLTPLNAGRIALGAALVARPEAATSMWVGRDGDRPGGRVLARGLGARDVALGAGPRGGGGGGAAEPAGGIRGPPCGPPPPFPTPPP